MWINCWLVYNLSHRQNLQNEAQESQNHTTTDTNLIFVYLNWFNFSPCYTEVQVVSSRHDITVRCSYRCGTVKPSLVLSSLPRDR